MSGVHLAGLERAASSAGSPATRGAPLDAALRASIEEAFDHDFSSVRVRSDAAATAASGARQARAATSGSEIAFAPGEYDPGTAEGVHLIAHELAHVVQQEGHAPGFGAAPDRGGERTARAAADRAALGQPARVAPRTPGGPQLDDEKPPAPAAKAEDDPGKTIGEGAKIVGEELAKNEALKKRVIEPFKERALLEWGRMPGLAQGALIGWGGGTYALALGSLLSSGEGRRALSGFNLLAPAALVPLFPVQKLAFTLPEAGVPSPRVRFDVELDLELLAAPLRAKLHREGLTVKGSFGLLWDPQTDAVTLGSIEAKIGLGKGLSLAGGLYESRLKMPDLLKTSDGRWVESKRSLPEVPKVPALTAPDLRFVLTYESAF